MAPPKRVANSPSARSRPVNPVIVEVLYFSGCPNHGPLLERLHRLVEQSQVDGELVEREVTSDAMAVELQFLGSPTVRVNGCDVDRTSNQLVDEFAMSCRLYKTADGLVGTPPDEWILSALQNRACG